MPNKYPIADTAYCYFWTLMLSFGSWIQICYLFLYFAPGALLEFDAGMVLPEITVITITVITITIITITIITLVINAIRR